MQLCVKRPLNITVISLIPKRLSGLCWYTVLRCSAVHFLLNSCNVHWIISLALHKKRLIALSRLLSRTMEDVSSLCLSSFICPLQASAEIFLIDALGRCLNASWLYCTQIVLYVFSSNRIVSWRCNENYQHYTVHDIWVSLPKFLLFITQHITLQPQNRENKCRTFKEPVNRL